MCAEQVCDPVHPRAGPPRLPRSSSLLSRLFHTSLTAPPSSPSSLSLLLLQIVCSIIIFVTSLTGQYHQGHFAADDVYIYTAFVVNCSQIAALYGLILFYQAMKQELKPIHPFGKFLCIKMVVFFTFWQSVFLSMLVAVGAITPTVTYDTDQESYGIDDFIICIEMFFFAIAHWYSAAGQHAPSASVASASVASLSHSRAAVLCCSVQVCVSAEGVRRLPPSRRRAAAVQRARGEHAHLGRRAGRVDVRAGREGRTQRQQQHGAGEEGARASSTGCIRTCSHRWRARLHASGAGHRDGPHPASSRSALDGC